MYESIFVEYQIPFCEPFLCSILQNGSDFYLKTVILWDCMPPNCQRNIKGLIAIICIMSILIIVQNSLVLAANFISSTRRILKRNHIMQNYSNYVISMSFADFLIGAVVLPMSAVFFHQEVYTPRKLSSLNTTVSFSNSSQIQNNYRNYASENISEELFHDDQTINRRNNALLQALGFFLHTSILISLYTMAAASADRFYISIKPPRSAGIKISRPSVRQLLLKEKCGHLICFNFKTSRSLVVVTVIWLLCIVLSVLPLNILPNVHYHHIGYMFGTVKMKNMKIFTVSWYMAILAFPLVITWIFSFLLWFVIWKRKQKLKQSSRNLSKQELSEKRPTEHKEGDSSYAFISRCSNTDTPIAVAPLSNTSSSSEQNFSVHQKEDSFSEAFSSEILALPNTTNYQICLNRFNENLMKCPKKRRPSSLDSSMAICKVEEEVFVESNFDEQAQILRKKNVYLNCQSTKNFPAAYVAKRILCRRSWEGTSSETNIINRQNNTSTPRFSTKCETHCITNVTNYATCTTSTPSIVSKNDVNRGMRSTPTRARRRSSIFRAREFITSNSFESNIARTLIVVITMFTIATLPLLVVLSQLLRTEQATAEQKNKEVTSLVVTITILLSNSLWNSLIYGRRMPYFRDAITKIFHRLCRCRNKISCNRFTRKLTCSNSHQSISELNRHTWL